MLGSQIGGRTDVFFFFQAEDGIRDYKVTGVQTCALPISTAVERHVVVPARRVERRAGEAVEPLDVRQARVVQHAGRRDEHLGLELVARSEERRVGKECRSRWSPYH